jgi:phosphoribosylanthranilate isomerase
VTVDIKFCGLTRPEDAAYAASLGAAYVGVIFAGGPRMLTTERAAIVLRDVPPSVRRVGVFADQRPEDIARTVAAVGLDVVQLHGATNAERIGSVRAAVTATIWPVLRVEGSRLPPQTAELVHVAGALLLDAFVPGKLGGTGVALRWTEIARELDRIRAEAPIILAGGLRPENVAEAIAAIGPNVVDVSSGVESAPGIKDHERMRAFRDAVMHASIPT